MSDQQQADMAQLMELPSFRRFLWRSIQSAGCLVQSGIAANGSDGRDLAYAEGRRSLGFELLRDAETALDASLRHPAAIITLAAVLREGAQTSELEKASGRRRTDRYRDSDGDDDGGADARG